MKEEVKKLGAYLLLGAGLLLGSHKAFCESGQNNQKQQMVQTLRENQNFDPPSCEGLGEFIENYLNRSQSYQGLLALSVREFKTKILEEESLSPEKKQALKTDLLKSLVLLEDTELVLMDQAEWIRRTLPDCLQTSPPLR